MNPETESVIAEPVIAAVAAYAAATVPGVIRLEPGLRGLAGSVVRTARQKIKGLDPAPTEGVRVTIEKGEVRLEIDLTSSGFDQVAAVGQAVQRTVARAVADATGLTAASVTVSIVDIEGGLR
ncbi:Asp23/Gls24 family envelope stress response protein [Amycolatopsis sp. NPDC059657]|uniref:Asp23/Gls24 family envelope stress response protein n=1 Tax=Amycolatopsis sp. NPDC059657 TaxID=3346899 RepID=UPI0036705CD3